MMMSDDEDDPSTSDAHHQYRFTGEVPLDELDLSTSDMRSVDYFSIDLNNGDYLSDCSSVSLPSLIDSRRSAVYRRYLASASDDDDDENDVIVYEEIIEVVEPSSRFEPVYSSSDDEVSFVTFEEESFYTLQSVNTPSNRLSEHTSVFRSDHIHHLMLSEHSNSLRRSARSASVRSRKRSLKLSNHSRSQRSRSRRIRLKKSCSSEHSSPGRRIRTGQRKSGPNAFRMGQLQDQMNEISQQYESGSSDEEEEEEEDHDAFTYKSLDVEKRSPFGPSAEALLQQRQAGSKRELLGVSAHTTDAIVYKQDSSEDASSSTTTSDNDDEAMSMDESADGFISFYEEETLDGSLDSTSNSASASESQQQEHGSSNEPSSLFAKKSGKIIDDDCSSCTQSLTESVDDMMLDIPLAPIPPPPSPPPPPLQQDDTPKVDLTKRAWASRQQVSCKLKQLEQQMNSMYGVGNSFSTLSTAPMTSMESMPSFRDSCFSIDAAMQSSSNLRASQTSFMQSSSSLRASHTTSFNNSSPSLLLEKRKQAESKRQQLRLAFDAISSRLERKLSIRSRSHSPPSIHSRRSTTREGSTSSRQIRVLS